MQIKFCYFICFFPLLFTSSNMSFTLFQQINKLHTSQSYQRQQQFLVFFPPSLLRIFPDINCTDKKNEEKDTQSTNIKYKTFFRRNVSQQSSKLFLGSLEVFFDWLTACTSVLACVCLLPAWSPLRRNICIPLYSTETWYSKYQHMFRDII